jgi:steroid delta-isomerase-like uncharacterized protein
MHGTRDETPHQATRRLLDDLIAAWNAHDLPRASQFYAENYRGSDVGQRGPQLGRVAHTQAIASFIRAFPDLHLSSTHVIEGDQAVVIWSMRGTHGGTFMGMPATGRSIDIRGVSILTIDNGVITHGHTIWDTAGLLRALRLLPELP